MKGGIFTVHPLLLRNFKMKGHLSFAVLDLSSFENRVLKEKIKYTPLAKFPSSQFDYTVTLEDNNPIGIVLDCLSKIKIKEIISHKIVDRYAPKGENVTHLTLRTTFQDPSGTLSGEFLKESESKIIDHLNKNGYELKK